MAGRFNKLFVNKLYMPDGKLKGQNDKMTRVTISATEANYLDGANILNDTALKAALLTTGGALQLSGDLATLKNVGTSAATLAQEGGYGARHTSKLTFTDWDIGAIAAAGAEAIGKLIYTFPSTGTIIVHHAGLVGDLDGVAAIAADTPDIGLGTVVGTGAVATLDGTSTFENIMTGQTAPDCNETDFAAHVTPTAGTDLVITKGATNKVFLNVADTWADASATLLFTGIIWLDWSVRTY
jgi:hypothetical protein